MRWLAALERARILSSLVMRCDARDAMRYARRGEAMRGCCERATSVLRCALLGRYATESLDCALKVMETA